MTVTVSHMGTTLHVSPESFAAATGIPIELVAEEGKGDGDGWWSCYDLDGHPTHIYVAPGSLVVRLMDRRARYHVTDAGHAAR